MKHKNRVIGFVTSLVLLLGCDDSAADRALADQIRQELESSAVLGGAQIEVTVNGGVATLSGLVRDEEQARRAEVLTARVAGVDSVELELELSEPTTGGEPPPVGAAPPAPEGEIR